LILSFEDFTSMLRRNESLRLGYVFIQWICLVQVSLLSKRIPRYLTVSEFGMSLLFKETDGGGCCLRVKDVYIDLDSFIFTPH